MKKFLMIALCLCIIFSGSFAEEVFNKNTMTLDEAVKYALEYNANIVDIKRTENDQKELYDDAKRENQKWRNKIRSGGYAFETIDEYLDCWGYNLELAELIYNNFLKTKVATEKSVEYSVKSMAYGIKEIEENIKLLGESIEKQKNDVKIAEVKLRLNMITEDGVKETKNVLESSQLSLESLRNSLSSMKINLKKVMGFDVNRVLEIELPEFAFEELNAEDIEKTIEDSLENNSGVITAKIEYKRKEINNMLAVKTQWFETKEEVRNAKKVFSDAELRLNNEIASVKENLKLLYESVKNNERMLKVAEEELNRANEKYEQYKVMYELGMLSKNDFDACRIAQIKAENTYNSAEYDNIALNNRWNIAISVGDIIEK